MIEQHHERPDGTGYPNGIGRRSLMKGARILALADAFDAMTHDRPYRSALPLEAALAELAAGAGSQFDADFAYAAVDVFGGLL